MHYGFWNFAGDHPMALVLVVLIIAIMFSDLISWQFRIIHEHKDKKAEETTDSNRASTTWPMFPVTPLSPPSGAVFPAPSDSINAKD